MPECPICATHAHIDPPYITCQRCGNLMITGSGAAAVAELLPGCLGPWDEVSVHRRSRLSHVLRHRQGNGKTADFCFDGLKRWRLDDPMPSPAAQLDALVLWLGDHQSDPALWRKVPAPEIEAWIGGKINRGSQGSTLAWLTKQKETADFVEAEVGDKRRLTMAGWMRYEELRLGRVVSRKAFMAMKFNEPIVESAYSDCFRPAARRADFDLFDLREQQRAGMIDDQMRVAIRNSRFVVADLTHACRGSYWEGGFAEGLGRPVIYTCEKRAWEAEKSHFDTNHLTTVIWDKNDLATAEQQLTAIIRNTLPDEAKMDD